MRQEQYTAEHIKEKLSRCTPATYAGDTGQEITDTAAMSTQNREDLTTTLAAIEARMERQIERMEQAEDRRADAYRREQEARDRLYSERFEATSRRLEDRDKVIDSKLDAMSGAVQRMTEKVEGFSSHLDSKVDEVKSSNRNTVLAMLGIAAATVLGLWGANSTIIGSATGIFDSGKKQAEQEHASQELLKELKSQAIDTRQLLEQIKAQQESSSARVIDLPSPPPAKQ